MKANVFDIQRFCVFDGPGIRTTVFFKGCPLRCLWCHNPESQKGTPQIMFTKSKCAACLKCLPDCPARSLENGISFHAERCTLCLKCLSVCPYDANKAAGELLDTNEILKRVLRDQPFYRENGGLTLSGGEPALQPAAALELINGAKQNGVSTVIETCGYGDEAFYKKAADLNAMFYYDIKAAEDGLHQTLTGVSNALIFKNLETLFRLKAYVVLRLPLIPGINDSEEALLALKNKLESYREYYHHAEIMPYHILGKSKADALGIAYRAPLKNAEKTDILRWQNELNAKKNRILLSGESAQ